MEIWTPERQALARAEAKSWLGTPHKDRLNIKGVGVDCINFVYEVLIAAGVLERALLGGYDTIVGLHEVTHKLKNAFKACAKLDEFPIDDPQFGDVVIFQEGKFSAHSGIYLDGMIYHALAGGVVTASLYAEWRRRLDSLLRFTETGLQAEPSEAARLMK